MTAPMYETARARGTEKKIGQLNPLKRGSAADEIARVALFLGSDESSYVNGQAWAVDGGLSAGHPFVPVCHQTRTLPPLMSRAVTRFPIRASGYVVSCRGRHIAYRPSR